MEEYSVHCDPIFDESPLEHMWRKGIHRTKSGDVIYIKNMTTDHLIKTIVYFQRAYNTNPLKEELENRATAVLSDIGH